MPATTKKQNIQAGPDKRKTKCFIAFSHEGHVDNKQFMSAMRNKSPICTGGIIRILYLTGDVLGEELQRSNIVQIVSFCERKNRFNYFFLFL